MPKKYKDIYDQIFKNSAWNGECLESTFKTCSDSKHRRPYFTHKRKMYSVPRVAWEYYYGQIKNNLHVCHHCDNPICFRKEHLFIGTAKENNQDMIRKGRDNNFGRNYYPCLSIVTGKHVNYF